MPEKVVEIVDEKGMVKIPRGLVDSSAASIRFVLEGKVGWRGDISEKINIEAIGNYNLFADALEIPEGIRKTYFIREGDVVSVVLKEAIKTDKTRVEISPKQ